MDPRARQVLEQTLGVQLFTGVAKLYLANYSNAAPPDDPAAGLQKHMVGGVIMMGESPLDPAEEGMLECEVIIIPKRLRQGGNFQGYRLDQILTGGYEKAENYSAVKEFPTTRDKT